MICKSSDTAGRINAFQRLMLQWSELHPYNATHVYRIARPIAPLAFADAIHQTYLATGVGMVELDADGLSYRHETDLAHEVQVVRGGANPDSMLAEHLTRELNHSFERPRCKPWRFSMLDVGPNDHYVIVTYDHWIADSAAARLVMRHVLDRYCGWDNAENRRPLDLYPGTYRELFAKQLSKTQLFMDGLRTLGHFRRDESVAQVAYSSHLQMGVQYELHRAVSGTIPRLRQFAKSQGASVHDLILAALGRALAEHLPRRATSKQQSISLGTIVDVRGDAQEDLRDSLGAFLGYYVVRLLADQRSTLADAAKCIAAATGPIKASRAYLRSLLSMKVASAVWPRLSEKSKPRFMRSVIPMTGGVSNVVVRDDWMQRDGAGCVAEYLRGVSTGPILPLVLTPTTLGEEMNVGVTYRSAGFSRQKIDGVMSMFLEQIEHPEGVQTGRRRRIDGAATLVRPAQPELLGVE